jgi:hypothetical protein
MRCYKVFLRKRGELVSAYATDEYRRPVMIYTEGRESVAPLDLAGREYHPTAFLREREIYEWFDTTGNEWRDGYEMWLCIGRKKAKLPPLRYHLLYLFEPGAEPELNWPDGTVMFEGITPVKRVK